MGNSNPYDQFDGQTQQQTPGNPYDQFDQSGGSSVGDKAAAAGLVGGAATAAVMLLRRRFPGMTGRAAQAFLDKLHGHISNEITPGGLPALGAEYKAFVNQLGRTNPDTIPKFSDFLANKGVKAPETMKLIEQAQSAGPKTPSQSTSEMVKRDEGAQQRTLDAYQDPGEFADAVTQDAIDKARGAPGAGLTLSKNFWRQRPEDFAEHFANLSPDEQRSLQTSVRMALGKMPYQQFARRFLGTDPAYAQERSIFENTLPQDARTRFIQQLKAEQMMHKGAIDFSAPGSVPGSGVMGNPIDAVIQAHEMASGGFHPLSWALRAVRGDSLDGRSLSAGNQMLFNRPEANIEPGVGVEPGSYHVPGLDDYSPSRWWLPDKTDAGIGAGVGAIDYGLESEDQDQR